MRSMRRFLLLSIPLFLVIAGVTGLRITLSHPAGPTTLPPARHGLNAPPPLQSTRTVGSSARQTRTLPTAVRRVSAAGRRSQAHVTAVAPTSPSYLVLIVLDGARPDYFTVPGIPHVQALMRNGTRYTSAWAGILESETPSGHASITSGSQPREDGILSFDWANSDNVSINLFDENKVRAGVMEGYMRQAAAPSIASLVHKQNPKAKVVALSGYKYYAADAMGGPDADVIMYYSGRKNGTFGPTAIPGHVPPAGILSDPSLVMPSRSYPLGAGNHMAMKLADVTFAKMRQQVTLINLPEFDWPLGHVDGANRDPRDVRTLMQGFDRDLAALENTYRQAGVLDRTLFVLTADHGFAPIDRKISKDVIDRPVLATGTKIIRDSYHTASYIWIQDEAKAALAAANIARTGNPAIQSVYFRSVGLHVPVYVRASGPDLFLGPGVESANQYLLSTFDSPNGPDIVVFLREHSMVVAGGEGSWKGDHGGSDWEAQNLPLILSGPGIRHGYVSSFPAPLMDIAPTALSLLHVPPTGMQGITLADALQSPSAGARSAQDAQGKTLIPVVSALQAESRLEVAASR